jgi:hypothetical protein
MHPLTLTLLVFLLTAVPSLSIPHPNLASRSLSTSEYADGADNKDGVLTDGPIWAKKAVNDDAELQGTDAVLTDGPIWAKKAVANEENEETGDVILTDGPIWARGVEEDTEYQDADVVLTDGPVWGKKSVEGDASGDGEDVVLTDGPIWAKRSDDGSAEAYETDAVLTDGPIWARVIENTVTETGNDIGLTDGPIWARGEEDSAEAHDTDAVLTDGPIWARGVEEEQGVDGGDAILTDGPVWAKKSVLTSAASGLRAPRLFSIPVFIIKYVASLPGAMAATLQTTEDASETASIGGSFSIFRLPISLIRSCLESTSTFTKPKQITNSLSTSHLDILQQVFENISSKLKEMTEEVEPELKSRAITAEDVGVENEGVREEELAEKDKRIWVWPDCSDPRLSNNACSGSTYLRVPGIFSLPVMLFEFFGKVMGVFTAPFKASVEV